MDSKVKLRIIKSGVVCEFTFEHAQNILRGDNYKVFECADDKHEFINNELNKRPSTKGGKKSTKSKSSSKGAEVSKPLKDTDGGV